MADLSEKTAIVTGAATGLGRATALAFAAAGGRGGVARLAPPAGGGSPPPLVSAGGGGLFLHTDVSRGEDVERMVATAVAEFGSLDCAFNNAGIALRGAPVAEMSEAEFDRAVAINLKGVWLCLKHESAQMLRQGGGAIVNTSSIMGVVSGPGLSAYSASKFGVVGLTRSVALDYARMGIRVNAVCPGGIGGTAITDAADNRADMEQLKLATPMGRLGVPREIADAVIWLCSSEASFVTGQSLAVDGGFTIW